MSNVNDSNEKNVIVALLEQWRAFFGSFKRTVNTQTEGTWYDDSARILTFILLLASVATGVSYALSNHIFFGWLGNPLAWYPAVLLALVLEAATVMLGLVFFSGLFRSKTWYEKPALGAVLFMGFVFYFACKWGYTLSNEGQGQLATMYATKAAQTDTAFVATTENPRLPQLRKSLASIDAQLGNASSAQDAAYSVRWKGKVTETGQRLAAQAGNNMALLAPQRASIETEIMRIETAQDSSRQAQRNFSINTQAQWTNLFGGYMEIFKIGCIAALALCTLGLEKYRQPKTGTTTPSVNTNTPPSAIVLDNGVRLHPIGFAYKGRDEKSSYSAPQEGQKVATLENGAQKSSYFTEGAQKVATIPEKVATLENGEQKSSYSFAPSKYPVFSSQWTHDQVKNIDDTFAISTKNIQAWIGKLKVGEVKPSTAHRNIIKRMERINEALASYNQLIEMGLLNDPQINLFTAEGDKEESCA